MLGGGCGSRQRQVTDGADVVFTDTGRTAYVNADHKVVFKGILILLLRLLRPPK